MAKKKTSTDFGEANITLDQWRKALEIEDMLEITADPSAKTVSELAGELGLGIRTVHRFLQTAVKQGKAKKYRKLVQDSLGRPQYYTAYILLKK